MLSSGKTKKELEDAKKEIAKLQQELKDAKSELRQCNEEYEDGLTTIDNLKASLHMAMEDQTLLVEYKAKLAEQERETKQLQEQLDLARKQAEIAMSAAGAARTQPKSQGTPKISLPGLSDDEEENVEDKNDHGDSLIELRAQLQRSEQEVQSLQKARDEHEDARKAHEQHVLELQSEHANLISERDRLQSRIDELRDEAEVSATLRSQLDEERAHKERVTEQHCEAQDNLLRVSAAKDALQEELEKTERELGAVRVAQEDGGDRVAELERELEEERRWALEAKDENSTLAAHKDEAQTRLREAEERLREVENTRAASEAKADQECSNLIDHRDKLQERLQEAESAREALETKLASIEPQLQDHISASTEKEERLQELENARHVLETKAGDQCADLTAQRDSLQDRLQELEASHSALKSKTEEEHAGLLASRDDLQERLRQVEDDRIALQAKSEDQHSDLRAQRDSLQERLQELEDAHSAHREKAGKDHTDLLASRDALQERLQEIENERAASEAQAGDERSELRAQRDSLQSRLQELEKSHSALEAKAARENADLASSRDTLQERLREAEDTRAALESKAGDEHSVIIKHRDSLQERLHELENAHSALQTKAEAERSDLTDRADTLQEHARAAAAEHEELRAKLAVTEQQLQAGKTEHSAALSDAAAAAELHKHVLTAEQDQWQEQMRAAEMEREELRAKLAVTEQQLQEGKAEHSAALSDAAAAADLHKNALTAEQDQWQEKLRAAEMEREDLRLKLAVSDQQLQAGKAEHSSALSDAVAAADLHKTALTAEQDQWQEQMRAAEIEREDLRVKLAVSDQQLQAALSDAAAAADLHKNALTAKQDQWQEQMRAVEIEREDLRAKLAVTDQQLQAGKAEHSAALSDAAAAADLHKNALTAEQDQWQEQLRAAEMEREELRAKLAVSDQQLQAGKAEHSAALSDAAAAADLHRNALATEQDQWQEQMRAVEIEREDLRAKLAVTEKHLQAGKAEHSAALSDAVAAADLHKTALTAEQERLRLVEVERGDLQTKLVDIEQQLHAVKSEHSSALSDSVAAADLHKTSLAAEQERLRLAEVEREELQAKLAVTEQQLQAGKAEHSVALSDAAAAADLHKALASEQERLRVGEVEREGLKAKLAVIEEQLQAGKEEHSAELSDAATAAADLRKALAVEQESRASLHQAHEDLQAAHCSLNEQLLDRNNMVAELQDKLGAAQQTMQAKEQTAQSEGLGLQEKLTAEQEHREALHRQKEELEAQLKDTHSAGERSLKAHADLQSKHTGTLARLSEVEESLRVAEAKALRADEVEERLRLREADFRAEVNAVQTAADAHAQDAKRAALAGQQANDALSTERKRLAHLQSEHAELAARNDGSEVARLREELAQSQAEANKLRKENAGLEQDIVELARMLTELKAAVQQYASVGAPCELRGGA